LTDQRDRRTDWPIDPPAEHQWTACRAARLLNTVAFVRNFLQLHQPTSTSARLLRMQLVSEARTDLPRPLGAFSFVMCMSGAMHPILHGANTPLPFLSQLLFHAAYLLLLLVSSARTAAAVLRWSHYSPEIVGLCVHLNSLAAVGLGGMGVISDVEILDQECLAHAPLLLVLFAYLYIGFVLPVYAAYRLEQHLKQQLQQEAWQQQQQQEQQALQQRQLRQLQQRQQRGQLGMQHQQQPHQQPRAANLHAPGAGAGDGAAMAPSADVLILLFVAVTCWGLVLMLHPLLSMLMWAEAEGWQPQAPA
jgi:hypothetical protein